MHEIVCHADAAQLPLAEPNVVPVLLYGPRPASPDGASIGGSVLTAVRRLGVRVADPAFDFLTIALAVTAADTFVRRKDAADGWTRQFRLTVHISDPDLWRPLTLILEQALRFLSGDEWLIEIKGGGPRPPDPMKRGMRTTLSGHDMACLFSGGLDSAIGALELLTMGRRPVLVSHSYRGDNTAQENVLWHLPDSISRFAANANPRYSAPNDTTMRTRSFNFVAYGTVVASSLARYDVEVPVKLVVPENGWIALNPPLTRRRIGSLSTRTAHPHFLKLVQRVVSEAGLPVEMHNPYVFRTKGEMLRDCTAQATLKKFAKHTVSCGKWKRSGHQCGRCVPCLIRRASYFAAGLQDNTYYRFQDLATALRDEDERDDLLAMMLAVKAMDSTSLPLWVARGGPLSKDPKERAQQVDVFRRGLIEVEAYLTNQGLL